MELDNPSSVRKKIMDFLAIREHSAKEVYKKLCNKVESLDILSQAIDKLIMEGLLDDKRFAEQYLHSRINKGFGPLRIKQELKNKGVNILEIESLIDSKDWTSKARQVLQKKIKHMTSLESKEILKLKRFLNYRGFDYMDIDAAFNFIRQEDL